MKDETCLTQPPVAETESVVFRSSAIHGLGGYAKTDIPSGTYIIEYVGEIIGKAESGLRCEQNNEYIFTLDDERDLDGNVEWNPARFINHSCAPNCEAEQDGDRIWIVAQRDIRAGEELTFNYNYDLEDYKDHPCQCGAPACVGYIVAEDFFEHVRRQHESAMSSADRLFREPAACDLKPAGMVVRAPH